MRVSSSLLASRHGLTFKELTVVLAVMGMLVLASVTGLRMVQARTLESVATTRASATVTALTADATMNGGVWRADLTDIEVPTGVELTHGAATRDNQVSVHVHADGTVGVSAFVDAGTCVVGRVTAVGDMPEWVTRAGFLCDASASL